MNHYNSIPKKERAFNYLYGVRRSKDYVRGIHQELGIFIQLNYHGFDELDACNSRTDFLNLGRGVTKSNGLQYEKEYDPEFYERTLGNSHDMVIYDDYYMN